MFCLSCLLMLLCCVCCRFGLKRAFVLQVQGCISLNIWFEPEESAKGKVAGYIHVSINEGVVAVL